MKKLKDFKAEKVEIKSIYGGKMTGEKVTTGPSGPCQDYYIDDNCDGQWGPGEPGNIPCP
jgi:hypothetical protein